LTAASLANILWCIRSKMSSYPKLTPNLPSAEVIQHARRGFTLIELLMVFAVIAILAAITFGITGGVRNTQGKAKAKGELAMISQALDSFKMTHGDFPWAAADNEASAKELFKALLGWKTFDPAENEFRDKETAEVPEQGPDAFTDVSKLTYIDIADSSEFNPDLTGNSAPNNHLLIDPWGNPYRYYYKKNATGDWENFGFVLYSIGPDGKDEIADDWDGVMTVAIREATDGGGDPVNLDNIYAGE